MELTILGNFCRFFDGGWRCRYEWNSGKRKGLDHQGKGERNQGGTGIKKKNLGSIFFVGPTTEGLPTYVIRHKSIYGNITSSELRFGTSSNPELGSAFKIIIT